MERSTTVVRFLLLAAGCGYCALLIMHFIEHLPAYQWDFRTFYLASQVHREGLNPYDLHILSSQAGLRVLHPFVYPPVTLYFFRLFTLFDYPTSFWLYLILKCAVLGGLFAVWRSLLAERAGLTFYPFCLLAYNFTILLDLRAGNVSLFEQLLIWLGVLLLLRGREGIFSASIVLASLFKLTPLMFLGLLAGGRERWLPLAAGSALLFAALIGAPFLLNPGWVADLLSSWAGSWELGRWNPSTLAFLTDLSRRTLPGAGALFPVLLYLAAVGAAVWLSARALPGFEDRRTRILFLCVVYALILPRFKDYSYILLLVPSYFILAGSQSPGVQLRVAGFTLASTPDFAWRWEPFPWWIEYLPLACACVVWVLYLRLAFSARMTPAGPAPRVE